MYSPAYLNKIRNKAFEILEHIENNKFSDEDLIKLVDILLKDTRSKYMKYWSKLLPKIVSKYKLPQECYDKILKFNLSSHKAKDVLGNIIKYDGINIDNFKYLIDHQNCTQTLLKPFLERSEYLDIFTSKK